MVRTEDTTETLTGKHIIITVLTVLIPAASCFVLFLHLQLPVCPMSSDFLSCLPCTPGFQPHSLCPAACASQLLDQVLALYTSGGCRSGGEEEAPACCSKALTRSRGGSLRGVTKVNKESSPDSEGEDRAARSPTANHSPSYPSSGGGASCRTTSLRPESFLFRLGQKEEKRK
ncbi:leucine-rich repeat and calponin homology domain-containing protein 3 isoform X3, partial [Lates japonicus]